MHFLFFKKVNDFYCTTGSYESVLQYKKSWDRASFKFRERLVKLGCPLAYWGECLLMTRETGVQSQVESYQRLKKSYLISPYLTLSIIKYGSRVKGSNRRKGVAPFPTPQCSSYCKRKHQVALDYSRQLHFTFLKRRIMWRQIL